MSTVTNQIRQQYELLPYPHRDPEEELKQIRICCLDELAAVNHYCFNGEMVTDKNFRTLVAGGGTGDTTVQLAMLLQNTDSEIIHVDLSEQSIDIARKRLEKRNLAHKVTFKHMSLLDLNPEQEGEFDYINCSGVLHHLEKPEEGLRVLTNVLKQDGAMGLMLYGLYGRAAIYQMQWMFKLMGMKGRTPSPELLETLKMLLDSRPESNWSHRGRELFPMAMQGNESELYDLYLHPSDQAYSSMGLHQFLETSGLSMVEHAYDRRHLYKPQTTFSDPYVRAHVERLPLPEQQEICEIYWGNVVKHSFWASRRTDRRIDANDATCIPFWSRSSRFQKTHESLLNHEGDTWSCTLKLAAGVNVNIKFEWNAELRRCMQLIDDEKSVEEIVRTVSAELHGSDAQNPELITDVQKTFQHSIAALTQFDSILLRRPGSSKFYVD